MPATTSTPTQRAIGVIRVSQVNGRRGESFASPHEQRDRIEAISASEGLSLLDCYPEMNVSGGAPLSKRTGLRRAVEAVEAGHADVIVVAYFDRLVRNLAVQGDVLERVERAKGRVLAADVGEVAQDTAARWLNSTMHGMFAEYYRRTTRERVAGAQVRAVAQGRPPMILPPGLVREGDRVVIDPKHADTVREAVRLRADGATIAAVREHLRANGIERSYHGTSSLLRSRLLIGEIVFGDLRGSIPALVDREVWERAQRASVPRGRKPKSDRLLARLGVLRCGTCGSRMVVGLQTQKGRAYPFYRCGRVREDCPKRVTVSAELVEDMVIDAVRELLDGIMGTASADTEVADAAQAVDAAQAALDGAIRAFAALESEPAAVERLTELRNTRDAARDVLERVESAQAATTVAVTAGDWDLLTVEERRGLIVAVLEQVTVAPGRGKDRIAIAART